MSNWLPLEPYSHNNDFTSGGFLNFQMFFILELNTENGEKTTLSERNVQNCNIHCKVVSIYSLF